MSDVQAASPGTLDRLSPVPPIGEMPRAFKDHIPGLDGLRGIAALLVLAAHVPAAAWGHVYGSLKDNLNTGWFGVDIFFVLSGFLITRILLVDKSRQVPLRYFLARRFLRIFPIYYMTLLLYGLWLMHKGELHGLNLRVLEASALYVSNFFFAANAASVRDLGTVQMLVHTWSLAVEEHFYLVWPLVVYALSYRAARTFAWLFFLPLGFISACVISIHFGPQNVNANADPAAEWIYRGTMCRAISLAWGAIFACNEAWLRAHARRLPTLVVGLLAAAVMLAVFRKLCLSETYHLPVRLVSFSMISASIVLTVIAMRNSTLLPQAILTSPPLRYVGRISYGVYLYHPFVFSALGVFIWAMPAPGLWWRAILAIAGTFIVASASFFLIEKPILKLQDRFRAKPRPLTVDRANRLVSP